MAFHSKGNSASTFARSHRRDKESILGLSGWLFADLLLAIAIVFLVVQETPGDSADAAAPTTTTTTTTTVPAVKSGLIADPSEQLIITVPGGARANLSSDGFRNILERSIQIKFSQSGMGITTDGLREQNYRVGFVIWFAGRTEESTRSYRVHFNTFVEWLLDEDLRAENQEVPGLPGYRNDDLRDTNDLQMRVFLFKSLQ